MKKIIAFSIFIAAAIGAAIFFIFFDGGKATIQQLGINSPAPPSEGASSTGNPSSEESSDPGLGAKIKDAVLSTIGTEEISGPLTWQTLSGSTYEGELIWTTPSGKSIRLERADGTTFVRSRDDLIPEHQKRVDAFMASK